MKIISRLIAVILFLFFFFFALKNTQEITLHFFLGYERTDPLVLILLVFFVIGAVFGVLAMIPLVLRHRREAALHRKSVALLKREAQQPQAQPQPDSVIPPQHLL